MVFGPETEAREASCSHRQRVRASPSRLLDRDAADWGAGERLTCLSHGSRGWKAPRSRRGQMRCVGHARLLVCSGGSHGVPAWWGGDGALCCVCHGPLSPFRWGPPSHPVTSWRPHLLVPSPGWGRVGFNVQTWGSPISRARRDSFCFCSVIVN